MTLHTRVSDLLGIEHPVVLAGMGEAATPALAAAVSNAGGLGMLGAAAASPRRLRAWIRETRARTDRPFGVDTILPASVRRGRGRREGRARLPAAQAFTQRFMEAEGLAMPSAEEMLRHAGLEAADRDGPPPLSAEATRAQMEVILEERVPVYAAGLGNPGPWIERLHAAGTRVLAVVGRPEQARAVAASGVDLIVAQGHEGGGHNAPVAGLALIPQAVDAAGGVPVLGAGAIVDGRGVAAALLLGAEGVWVGTAFLATPEAGIPDFQKQALVASAASDTTVSRSLTGKPVRLLRGAWSEAWERGEVEPLPMPYQAVVAAPAITAAHLAQRRDVDPGIAGQGVGGIRAVRPAAEVVADLVAGAEEALARVRRCLA